MWDAHFPASNQFLMNLMKSYPTYCIRNTSHYKNRLHMRFHTDFNHWTQSSKRASHLQTNKPLPEDSALPDRNPHCENHSRRPTGVSPWDPEYRVYGRQTDRLHSHKASEAFCLWCSRSSRSRLLDCTWETAAEPSLSQPWSAQIKHKASTCKLIRYYKKKKKKWYEQELFLISSLRPQEFVLWLPSGRSSGTRDQ